MILIFQLISRADGKMGGDGQTLTVAGETRVAWAKL
jgi:hypothetical protein